MSSQFPPLFLLQIVRPDGTKVRLPGGGELEKNLIEYCTKAICRRPVGIFRTQAQVRQAIVDGLTEALNDLKRETIKVL